MLFIRTFFHASTAILILLITLFISTPLFAQQNRPSLYFSPSNMPVTEQDQFNVNLYIDTAGKNIGGAGAKFKYNTAYLKIINIAPSEMFADYPVVNFDNRTGTAAVSGIVSSADNLYSGNGIFAIITFESLKKGTSKVNFDFVKGSTTDSNLASNEGNGDILEYVNSLAVTASARTTGSAPSTVSYDDSYSSGSPDESDNQNNEADSNPLAFWSQTDETNTDEVVNDASLLSPITAQPPISDPEPLQEQPAEQIVSKKDNAGNESLGFFAENYEPILYALIAIVVIITMGAIAWFVIKKKRSINGQDFSNTLV